jgi:hypothetical protein
MNLICVFMVGHSMTTKKTQTTKIQTYRVERVDISHAIVNATSPEEAIDIANDNPGLWDVDIGDVDATLTDD